MPRTPLLPYKELEPVDALAAELAIEDYAITDDQSRRPEGKNKPDGLGLWLYSHDGGMLEATIIWTAKALAYSRGCRAVWYGPYPLPWMPECGANWLRARLEKTAKELAAATVAEDLFRGLVEQAGATALLPENDGTSYYGAYSAVSNAIKAQHSAALPSGGAP